MNSSANPRILTTYHQSDDPLTVPSQGSPFPDFEGTPDASRVPDLASIPLDQWPPVAQEALQQAKDQGYAEGYATGLAKATQDATARLESWWHPLEEDLTDAMETVDAIREASKLLEHPQVLAMGVWLAETFLQHTLADDTTWIQWLQRVIQETGGSDLEIRGSATSVEMLNRYREILATGLQSLTLVVDQTLTHPDVLVKADGMGWDTRIHENIVRLGGEWRESTTSDT